MNKTAKRIIAGVSAAVMFVSAVGVGTFTNSFMKTSYADSGSIGKNGKSTGFSNLEQDTEGDNYNTGYGLHTNKTATEAADIKDGRTFDVNLESWYVGENPVDVATILDASGSMAWTVDTLDPIEIDPDSKEIDGIESKYGKINNIDDLITLQNKNGGYLPQDVVDCILDKTETDDSKLSYAGYKYYVYEARSSVSEFVPLGYWDGGSPLIDESLIGYYPFDGTLENQAPKASEKSTAKLIEQDSTGFNTEKIAERIPVEFSDGAGLDLYNTDKNGNVVIDISSIKENDFTVSFDLLPSEPPTDKICYNTPLIYVGNKDKSSYFSVYRGRNGTGGSTGSSNHLRFIYTNGDEVETVTANGALDKSWTKWCNCQINVTKNAADEFTISYKFGSVSSTESYTLKFAGSELYIVLGGEETLKYDIGSTYTDISKNTIKNLKIKAGTSEVANFPLTNNLNNTTSGSEIGNAFLMKNGDDGNFNVTEEIDAIPVEPTYKEIDGNQALDLNETAKNGAVLLDAVPDITKDFTISMKLQKTGSLNNDPKKGSTDKRNIFYLGSKNTSESKYLQFFRSAQKGGYLELSKDEKDELNADYLYYQGGLVDSDKWYTNTLVFKYIGGDKFEVTPYVNGKPAEEDKAGTGKPAFDNGGKPGEYNKPDNISFTVNKSDLVFLLGALQSNSEGSEHYIDDLCVFSEALTAEKVNYYFGDGSIGICNEENSKNENTAAHACAMDGTSIAQIAKTVEDDKSEGAYMGRQRLADNPYHEERRGWYYVNSHSAWGDIAGCLEGGKQYIGILKERPEKNKKGEDNDSGEAFYDHSDTVTVPSAFKDQQKEGDKYYITETDNDHSDYVPPTNERSIRFYVDKKNHLRCFVWSGSDSKDDARTFCSVVYEKKKDQITKYQQLNEALNQFYKALATNSDLTNSAIVRYSTYNAVNNLNMLVMKDWTNWSEYYQETKRKTPEAEPEYKDYLFNMLIPDEGETSIDTAISLAQKIKEYPYVMTGGTYTWIGLKSFYDNMVNTKDKESGDRVYDIANDARDKYVIIFTDGRDNTQDFGKKEDGTNDYENSTNYKRKNYVNEDDNNPYKGNTEHKVGDGEGHEIQYDGDLAEAWADKLKEEGYTIYCVMMATGSISQTANKDEYNRAHDFLTTLAGSEEEKEQLDKFKEELKTEKEKTAEEKDEEKIIELTEKIDELNKEISSHVIVADPSSKGNTTVEAFQQILTQIQQPRNDYTVQDYIDPRFNLVDKGGNLYQLGAGGNITIKKTSGKTESAKVGNVIKKINDDPDITEAECKKFGLEYTPQDSFMVNRSAKSGGGYTDGDGVGTGYIYYDDEKDMYYLRWTDQIIPMENEAFDTDTSKSDTKYLNVWSATIRLKAKDDFIGGNDILTNGNEAGENLVFSEATIQNMDKDKNYELYGFTSDDLATATGKIPYRKKLEALSGTNRKINAVDAGGVSQAVYGNGIDIPSSGFPRVVVDVRLKPLDAKDLNDVIYMGEVISPTMMLADLENGYMTGSYYLEYLERYAYRVYGKKADQMPLIELLNQWLKINIKKEAEKTFTIPYIYLPDPKYNNGKLVTTEDDKVVIENSAGLDSGLSEGEAFNDLNLRDVTGFITYTWKREDPQEEQQKMEGYTDDKYDITREYVVKNAEQIKYNLQLKFTPLKDDKEKLKGFVLDNHFITTSSGSGVGDKFFNVKNGEFNDTDVSEWSIDGRAEYLRAMVKEEKTYEPHIMYDKKNNKWVLVDKNTPSSDFAPENAIKYYKKEDTTGQTSNAVEENKLTDKGVYDWDSDYKKTAGTEQIENENIKDYYTGTPKNVQLVDVNGEVVTDETGNLIKGKGVACSLVANTTYVKDVVNGALALELVVDGKYLSSGSPITVLGKTYTFEATRYYDDPIDPLPYGDNKAKNADTGEADTSTGKVEGKNYRLTFTVDESSLPKEAKPDVLYTVWAKLIKVEVEDSDSPSNYIDIDKDATTTNSYLGYAKVDALPIGTYVISVNDSDMSSDPSNQYYIGDDAGSVYFKYLKLDNASTSYTYDKFPADVYGESKSAPTSTGDGEYLIWNGSKDNATKNIADCSRTESGGTQELTFCFGTNEENNSKGYDRNDAINHGQDYAKDRLGIILLSRDNNALTISKEVTNTDVEDNKTCFWEFTVNFKPEDAVDFASKSEVDLKWYKDDVLTETGYMGTYYPNGAYPEKIKFENLDGDGTYTATVYLKHNEKVRINGLPEGTWQVTEVANTDLFYSPHNNAHGLGDGEWEYERADATSPNIQLNPASHVDFVNEFPYELPSAGGIGVDRFIFFGTVATVAVALTVIASYYKRRKRRRIN